MTISEGDKVTLKSAVDIVSKHATSAAHAAIGQAGGRRKSKRRKSKRHKSTRKGLRRKTARRAYMKSRRRTRH